MPSIKVTKRGISVRLTNNLAYSVSMVCAAILLDEGEDPFVRAIYNVMPDRKTLAHQYHGLVHGSNVYYVVPEALPALSNVLALVAQGGWAQPYSSLNRIKEINAISTLTLLALAGKQTSS